MNLYKQYFKQGLIALALFSIYACEKDPEQHLELGNWYLQKGLIDDAITEYREVSRLLPPDHSKLDREQFKILGTAHYLILKKDGGNTHLEKQKIVLIYLLLQILMS